MLRNCLTDRAGTTSTGDEARGPLALEIRPSQRWGQRADPDVGHPTGGVTGLNSLG